MNDQEQQKWPSSQVRFDEVPIPEKQTRRRDWKPFANRTPFLLFVLVILLFCVTALEVLVRRSVPLQQKTSQNVDRLLVRNAQAATISSSTETVRPFTSTDAYLNLGTTSKSTDILSTTKPTAPLATPPGAYLQLSSSSTTLAATPLATTALVATTNNPVKPTAISGGLGYGQPQPQTWTSSLIVSASSSSLDRGLTTMLSSSTSSTHPAESQVAQVLSHFEKPDLQVEGAFKMSWYFTAQYVPSIIAVLIKESWSLIACGLKMMEPFYLLNLAGGAAVKDSLMVNYLDPASMFPFRQALRGSVTMIVVIVGSLVMQLLAPLASESMTVVSTFTNIHSSGRTDRLNPAWALNLAFVRILQGILSVVGFLILFMAFFGWRRHSPLTANPSMIATMASLLNHPSTVKDINSINPRASKKRMAESTEHKRYVLADYLDPHGVWQYGLMRLDDGSQQSQHKLTRDDLGPPSQFTSTTYPARAPEQRRNDRSTSQTMFDILFLSLILSLLGTIIAYRIDMSDSGFNRFFNSGQFGPKFVLSLGASFVTTTFHQLEREVRTTIPCRALAARNAQAQTSILRPVDGTALSGLLQSLRHGSWFHAFIALTALLGDVLIIAVAGIPFNESLTLLAYYTSTYLSIGIIVVMLAAAISVFRWRVENKRLDLPSRPNGTVLRVWMACSNRDNQVRALLGDLGRGGVKELKDRCRREGGTYSAGWVVDEFGREVWRVDKD